MIQKLYFKFHQDWSAGTPSSILELDPWWTWTRWLVIIILISQKQDRNDFKLLIIPSSQNLKLKNLKLKEARTQIGCLPGG